MKKQNVLIVVLLVLMLLSVGGAGWLWVERGTVISANATTQAESLTLKEQITEAGGVQDKNRQLQDQVTDLQQRLAQQGQATPITPLDPTVPTPEPNAPTATPSDPNAPTATPGGPGGVAPPADVLAVMERIEDEVIELRGLPETRPVERRFLTRAELRTYIETESEKETTPDEYRRSSQELWLLGLGPKDLDLKTLYIDLQTEQIAGFYQPEEDTFYLVGDEPTLPPLDQITYAHEFDHNLQDQTVDLNAGLEVGEFDADRSAAFRALVEGDATILMTQWFQKFLIPSMAQEELLRFSQELQAQADSTVLDSAPTIVREGLTFPYDQGQSFVQELYNAGGWPAVTTALSDPPTSTEQIIHPEKYTAAVRDEPKLPERFDLTAALGAGWTTVTTNTLGEFDLQIMLRDGGASTAEAVAAAAGWGGVRYALYEKESATETPLLQLTTRWDSASEGDEFLQTFRSLLTTSGDVFRREDVVIGIKGNGAEFTILFSPDETALRSALAALP